MGGSDMAALIAIAGTSLLTSFQMMGALSRIAVSWPEPFVSIVSLASILNFKRELFDVGCVVTMTSLTQYFLTAFGFCLPLIVMVVLHFFHLFVFQWRVLAVSGWRHFLSSLGGACGTVFLDFFISIASATVAPFDCDAHP